MPRYASVLKLAFFFAFNFALNSCKEDTISPEINGTISGIVVEEGTNNALENVSIETNPASSAIATDNKGQFLISGIPVGNYNISASKSGYRTKSLNILVTEDKTSEVRIILEKSNENNRAPNKPDLRYPLNMAENQPVKLNLTWSASDPDKSDSLHFDVEVFESGMVGRRVLASNISDTTVVADGLNFNTVYYWQVTVRDEDNAISKSDIWSFKTEDLPDLRYLFIRRQNVNSTYDIFASDSITTINLTNSSANELYPVLSPLRDKIAYSSNQTGQSHIYTMDRDGSNKRKITVIPVTGYHNEGLGFAWSPDASQIIYANYDKLYRINRDGSGITQVATAPANRHFRQLDWTLYGNKIVAQTIGSNIYDSEIYLMNADGTNMQMFVGNLPGRLENPTFSINGQDILFTRDVSGFNSANGRQLDAHVFKIKTDSSAIVDLSVNKIFGNNDLYPRFSPNGARIIFATGSNDDIAPKEVWTMRIDGTDRRKLFENAEMPDWK